MKKIIVIGGGAAGAKAASKAKRLNPENQVELYTNGDLIAYSLCGLPYYIEGIIDNINKLIIKTPQDFQNNGISVFLNSKLEKIFPEKKCVLIDNNHIFYDELILALGANVNIPKAKNVCANNIYTLHSIDDGIKIREKMRNSKKVVIIGGGYIALELCEAFIKNGLEVVILEKKSMIASDYDEDFSKIINKIVSFKTANKAIIKCNQTVEDFLTDENNNFKGVKTQDNQEFYGDFCILATGASPNVEIARNAGINIGLTGAIYVDNKMRTNIEHIYACGDCAQKYCIITKQPVYIGLGSIANKEGRVAAINAVSQNNHEVFDGILSSTITKFFDYTFSKTGLSYKKALEISQKINLEPVFVNVVKKDKASYMPDVNELNLKLIADKRSGEILGAQSIGSVGTVLQRINTITSAIKSRLTVEQMLHLDLPYAPFYSSSIDIILTALYKLKEIIKK